MAARRGLTMTIGEPMGAGLYAQLRARPYAQINAQLYDEMKGSQ